MSTIYPYVGSNTYFQNRFRSCSGLRRSPEHQQQTNYYFQDQNMNFNNFSFPNGYRYGQQWNTTDANSIPSTSPSILGKRLRNDVNQSINLEATIHKKHCVSHTVIPITTTQKRQRDEQNIQQTQLKRMRIRTKNEPKHQVRLDKNQNRDDEPETITSIIPYREPIQWNLSQPMSMSVSGSAPIQEPGHVRIPAALPFPLASHNIVVPNTDISGSSHLADQKLTDRTTPPKSLQLVVWKDPNSMFPFHQS